jgi:hypothetical protein
MSEAMDKLKAISNPTGDPRKVKDKLISMAEKHDKSLDRNIKSFEKAGNDKGVEELKGNKAKVRAIIKKLKTRGGGGGMISVYKSAGKSLVRLMRNE